MDDKRWVQVLLAKVSGVSGETMVETLVAILVSALSLLLLSTAIGSSINTIRAGKISVEQYYAAESDMVAGGGTSDSMSVIVDVPLRQKDISSGATEFDLDVTASGEGIALYERSS